MVKFPWLSQRTMLPPGLDLQPHKAAITQRPTATLPLAPELSIALLGYRGSALIPRVKVGEQVVAGQLLADDTETYRHAPAAGTVVALETRAVPHPPEYQAPCLVIRSDTKSGHVSLPPWPDFRQRTPTDLLQRIRELGVVGLGGAVFPIAQKLQAARKQPLKCLILNGAECEPYISADEMLMRQRPGDIIDGLAILCHILGVTRAMIAVEDSKPAAIAALRNTLTQVTPEGLHISLEIIPTRYPLGGEVQLIQQLTGQVVPSGAKPLELGIICHNVASARAVADAVLRGQALVSRYVSVGGDGVQTPGVWEVPLGTPVNWLLQHCGGYREGAGPLLMGGPMMGIHLPHDQLPVGPGSNHFLLLASEPAAVPQRSCIRCGDCHQVCPMGLLPQQLYRFIQGQALTQARELHLFDCIECGCCAAVCPSDIPLVDYYRFAKTELRYQDHQQQQASAARERYQARHDRLQQAEASRRQQRSATPVANTGEDRQAAIQAARERAKRRRASRQGSD